MWVLTKWSFGVQIHLGKFKGFKCAVRLEFLYIHLRRIAPHEHSIERLRRSLQHNIEKLFSRDNHSENRDQVWDQWPKILAQKPLPNFWSLSYQGVISWSMFHIYSIFTVNILQRTLVLDILPHPTNLFCTRSVLNRGIHAPIVHTQALYLACNSHIFDCLCHSMRVCENSR